MSTTEAVSYWESILEYLRDQLSAQQFETWFTRVNLVDFSDGHLVLAVPNSFYKEWIEKYYRHHIKAGAQLRLSMEIDVRVNVDEAAFPKTDGPPLPATREKLRDNIDLEFDLSPDLTFDNFVLGPSNRLCHAACQAIADSPAKAYNPFFMHGSVGLGKTHLIQAICHTLLKKYPDHTICYMSCESFVNHFI